MAILTSNELATHPFLTKLGPDVLDQRLEADVIVERLTQTAFINRRLGSLYLDQCFLAGIGNYLRSEILFDAGLHPALRPRDLTAEQSLSLANSTLRICRRAYRHRGVVNDPARVAAMRTSGMKRHQYRFAVFSRDGLPCYRCATPIERRTVLSRRLYLCPSCQVQA